MKLKTWLSFILLITISTTIVYSQKIVDKSQNFDGNIISVLIINIIEFVQWPDDSKVEKMSEPFVIGIAAKPSLIETLQSVFIAQPWKGKKSVEKKFKILPIERDAPTTLIQTCSLLFISHTREDELSRLLQVVKGKPILVIGNGPDFAKKGCHVNLYFRKGKIRFNLNANAMFTSNLMASLHLFRAADKVFRRNFFKKEN